MEGRVGRGEDETAEQGPSRGVRVAYRPQGAAENLLEIQILRIQTRSNQIPKLKQLMSR